MHTAVVCITFVGLCIVHAVHPGCDCVLFSGTYGQSHGQFMSPDFPQPYDPALGCILYTFTGQRDQIVELTFNTIDLPYNAQCSGVDNIALYLHLDRAEINEETSVNERLCGSVHSGRVQYYSAFQTLILAFQTFGVNGHRDREQTAFIPDLRLQGNVQSSSHLQRKTPQIFTGFNGTYRFISKSQFRSDGQRIAGSVCDYQFISSSQGLRKGKFYSPLYPSKYPGRSRCFYRFYGRYQERVKIAFEKLVLGEDDISCLSNPDGLKVYDGGDIRAPVIAHLCGSVPHVEIWSSSSSLLIEFFSDSNITHSGFAAKFFFHPAVTIYELFYDEDETDGEFDESDQQNHTTYLSTQPTVTTRRSTSPSTTRSTTKATTTTRQPSTTTEPMTTTRLTKATTTKTTVTKATSTTTTTTAATRAPTMATVPLSKTTTQAPITALLTESSARYSTLNPLPGLKYFQPEVSDSMSFYDENLTSPCDQIIRSDSSKNGTLSSPNYPASYPASMQCNYEFRGHGKERVQIIFTDFHLYHPHVDPADCDVADRVTAYVTSGGQKEKIDDFCGSSTPRELMSNSATMSLSFHSSPTSKGAKGFQARYSFVTNFGISVGEQLISMPCAFQFNSTVTTNGSFWSPNYPGYYPRDTECHYFFYGRVGERVRIHFSYFDIEGMSPCIAASNSDYVEVSNFMSVDRKLPRYCGQIKDLSLESDGAFFRVTFKSNDRFDATGFYASYQFTPVADAVTITRRRSGSTSSEGYRHLPTAVFTVLPTLFVAWKTSRL